MVKMNVSELLLINICMQLEPWTVFFAAALRPSALLLSPLWQLSSPPSFPPVLPFTLLLLLRILPLFSIWPALHIPLSSSGCVFFTCTLPFCFSSLPSVEYFPFPAFLLNLLSICFPSVAVVITFSLLSLWLFCFPSSGGKFPWPSFLLLLCLAPLPNRQRSLAFPFHFLPFFTSPFL